MILPLPKMNTLPMTLPIDGAVRIELEEGVPIFRASQDVQDRIETLLEKQKLTALSTEEEEEFDSYEEMDDYLGFVNRAVRSLVFQENQ